MDETGDYTLWCVDRGESCEPQFLGPYQELDHAESEIYGDERIRRCRPATAGGMVSAEGIIELLEECPEDLACDGAWADWEEQIFTLAPGAQEALNDWADKYIRVKAYVCEGDEP